ncbi:LPD38 domain-containing protein [Haemophilus haemolyticus]|uniref:MuF-C-terminal domain-containing protein n=1 Tax=Haemophilus haemolyticus TaxID=726 RepID=UPI000AC0435F|nr:LPD38 domain-containing protein [Haemophilus haemolyticus]
MSNFYLPQKEYDNMIGIMTGNPSGKKKNDITSAYVDMPMAEQKPEQQGLVADTIDAVQMGAWKGASDIAHGLGALTGMDWLHDVGDWAAKGADENLATMSDEMKTALNQNAFDGEDQGVRNIRWWAGNLGSLIGQNLDTVLTLGAGKAATFGIKQAGKLLLKKEAAEQVGKTAVEQAAKRGIPQKYWNMVGVTAAMSAMSGGGRYGQKRDEVMGMTNEQLAQLPQFSDAYYEIADSEEGKGKTVEQIYDLAKSSFADQVGRAAALNPTAIATDLVTNAVSGLGGGFLGLSSAAKTIKGGLLKGAMVEGGTEAVQGIAEQYALNKAEQDYYNPNKDLTEGMADNAIDGAVLGGVFGSAMGGLDAHSERSSFNKQKRVLLNHIDTGNEAVDSQLRNYVDMLNQGATELSDLVSASRVQALNNAGIVNARARQAAEDALAQQQAKAKFESDFFGEKTQQDHDVNSTFQADPQLERALELHSILGQFHNNNLSRANEFMDTPMVFDNVQAKKDYVIDRAFDEVRNIAQAYGIDPQDGKAMRRWLEDYAEKAKEYANDDPQAVAPVSNLQSSANIAPEFRNGVVSGANDEIDVGNGNYQPFQYEVVDASTLTPTQQKDENQFRDRDRASSQAQINNIARNLDPRKLAASPTMDIGAPLLALDGKTIIAGNGRSMALRQAYQEGGAEGYRQFLKDNADRFGVDSAQLDTVENPVLIRRLTSPVDIAQVAINSNEQGGMRMSELEQAKVDARRLPSMDSFVADEHSEINSTDNQQFIRQFIQNQPENLRNELLDSKGNLSQTGVQRIRNAMLYQAYGDSQTLSRLIENTDQGAKNVLNALTALAPKVAQTQQDINSGVLSDVSISRDIIQAVEKYNQLNEQGYKITDYLAQNDFVGDLTPEAREILTIFDENRRSGKRIAQVLGAYFDQAQMQGNLSQASMFGDVEFDKLGSLQQAKNADEAIRLSLNESANSDFAKAVDDVANGKFLSQIIEVGTTPSVLKMLGLPDANVVISGAVLKKVMLGKHNVTAETLKQLPKQINDPVAVMKSSTQQNGYVVLTELMENVNGINKPVVAALHLKQTSQGIELINIASVYGRNNSQIQRGLENDLLYWNKKKGVNFLDNLTLQLRSPLSETNSTKGYQFARTVGLQLPSSLTSVDNLSVFNVKTEAELSQYLSAKNNQETQINPEIQRAQDILRKNLGKAAEHIEVIAFANPPEDVKNLITSDVEGWFNPKTGKVTLIADSINATKTMSKEERLQFVAWHEMAHRGINVGYKGTYDRLMAKVGENKVVSQIADAIQVQRKNTDDLAATNRAVAIEEAIAEVMAAHETGKWNELESRYGVEIKKGQRQSTKSWLAMTAQRIKDFLSKFFGVERTAQFSDEDVLNLISRIKNSSLNETRETGDLRFSRNEEFVDGNKSKISDKHVEDKRTSYLIAKKSFDEYFENSKEDKNAFSMFAKIAYGEKTIGTNGFNFLENQISPKLESLFEKADGLILADFNVRKLHDEFSEAQDEFNNLTPYEKAKNNGETELTEKQWQQVRSPEFKAWFGDWENDLENSSKVVNKRTGEPLVMYHATNWNPLSKDSKDIAAFRKGENNGISGKGIYFSEYPMRFYGDNVLSVFLNIRNPVQSATTETNNLSLTENVSASKYDNLFEQMNENSKTSSMFYVRGQIKQNWNELFPEFDGIMNGQEVVVKNPNQIKSATDNTGAFSKENADIRFSRANTAQSALDLSQTAKAKSEPSFWDDLKAKDYSSFKERFNQVVGKVDEWFADSLRPVNDWIDSMHLEDQTGNTSSRDHEKRRLKDAMYTAKGKRDALNSELEQAYLKPILSKIAALSKETKKSKHPIDELTMKRLVGNWISALYSIEKNIDLLNRDEKVMRDTKRLLDNAKQNGTSVEVRRLNEAYLKAKEQYDNRKSDIYNTDYKNKGNRFKVGVAGGWSIPEAELIMKNTEQRISKSNLESIAEMVYDLNQSRLDIDRASGRYTESEYQEYKSNRHYVPLTGDPNADVDVDIISGAGSNALNIARDKTLKGRTRSEAEDAIDAVWKSIGKSTTYAGFAEFKSRIDDLYETEVTLLKDKGYSDAEAREQASANLGISKRKMQGLTRSSDNVLIRKEGSDYYEYELPTQVMESLRNDNVEHANAFLKVISKPTGWYARGVTQWTVTFAPMNMLRDTWEKSEFIRVQKLYDKNNRLVDSKTMDKIGRDTIKNALADKEVWQATKRLGFGQELRDSVPAERMLKQLLKEGGVSNYGTYLDKSEVDLIKKLRKENNPIASKLEKAGKILEGYNKTFDTVSALASYKALIENGIDPKQAAATTLELTNFRKTGSKMRGIKALYMFSQPTVMGAANLMRYLSTRKGQIRFIGYMAVMTSLYTVLRSVDDEDEGGNKMDQLGDITRYIPIPLGEGKYFKIPVGFGMAQMAWNFSTNIVKGAVGDISLTEAGTNMLVHSLKTFSPVSPSEISAAKYPMEKITLTVTPTILQPIMQNVVNRSAFGNKITTNYVRDDKLKAEQSKATTAQFWKDVAINLNDTMGIDMHPEQIKNLFDGYSSMLGSLKELNTVFVENPNREELGRKARTPFLNQFIGTTNEFAIQSRYYEASEEAGSVYKEYKSRKERNELGNWLDADKMKLIKFHEQEESIVKKARSEKANLTRALRSGKISAIAYENGIKRYNKDMSIVQAKMLHKYRIMEGLNTN